jgi:hypothetical protein
MKKCLALFIILSWLAVWYLISYTISDLLNPPKPYRTL